MIRFYSETNFSLPDQEFYKDWLSVCIEKENGNTGTINYIFCNDEYLLKINQQHLNHDYYTDIITFDYTEENTLNADIFISVERVADNAYEFDSTFDLEIARVMVHGILHLIGYKDYTDEEKAEMRKKENQYLNDLIEPI